MGVLKSPNEQEATDGCSRLARAGAPAPRSLCRSSHRRPTGSTARGTAGGLARPPADAAGHVAAVPDPNRARELRDRRAAAAGRGRVRAVELLRGPRAAAPATVAIVAAVGARIGRAGCGGRRALRPANPDTRRFEL